MTASVIGSDDRGRRELEQQLASWWAMALGLTSIDVDDDLFRLGCDPERGAMVLNRIRHELKVDIPTSDLFEARTIAKLADLIEIRQASMDSFAVISIRRGGRKQPLILVHGVGGNLLGFVSLVRLLDADQPVYGIQAQALHTSGTVLVQIEAMAAYYVSELRKIQPNGPYAFLGLSFGGLVAYEMAQQLVAAGETVNVLAMLDTWQPGYMRQLRSEISTLARILHRLEMFRIHTRKLSFRQTLRYALGRLKGRALRLMYLRIGRSKGVTLPGSMRRVRDINLMAGARYTVRPYSGRITLFRAFDPQKTKLPEDLGWRMYAQSGVEIVQLPGDHGQVLSEPNVSFLARKLTAELATQAEQLSMVSAPVRLDFELFDNEWIESTAPEEASCPAHFKEVLPLNEDSVLADHEIEVPASRFGSMATGSIDQKPPRQMRSQA